METLLENPALIELAPEKLFDLCMVEKLCRGNTEQVRGMIEIFIAEIPDAVQEIKKAFQSNDHLTVKKIAHRIKPVLSFYAVVTLEQEMPQIEQLADTAFSSIELKEKIDFLNEVVDRIVQQMKTLFTNPNNTPL